MRGAPTSKGVRGGQGVQIKEGEIEGGEMKIELWDIGKLKPYPKNAKKHDEKQIANVANSIKRFGWQQPIVCDEEGTVVIGHCRLLAAQTLGMKDVPVTVASGLTDEELRELRIADNKSNESPWDFFQLEDDLEGLDFEGFDFDFHSVSDVDINELFEEAPPKEPEEPEQIQCPHCKMWFTPEKNQ